MVVAKIPSWPVLRSGASGQNVLALQELLIYKGYSVTVTGRFDPATIEAVTRFQQNNKIVPNSSTPESSYGIVGERTLSALVVPLQSSGPKLVVYAVQYLLNKFEHVTVNGDLQTSFNGISSFKEKMGLNTSTVIDYTLWQYLFGYNSYTPLASTGVVSQLNDAQMYVNANYILRYLMNQGFTKNAACGILGNMRAETTKIDPGLWEQGYRDSPRGGYGLVQWTTYNYEQNKDPNPFMIYAASKDVQLISNSKACGELDSLALDNPKKLMDAELAWLVKSMGSTEYFFYNPNMNHTELPKMTFQDFKESPLDASTLAIIFHDYYERSSDSLANITKKRATPAQNYFDTGSFD